MPTIQRTDLSASHAHITITITREDLQPKLKNELKRLSAKAQIKGFRPGHVPADYLKKVYGKSVFGDVFNNMLADELSGYLEGSNLRLLGQPLPLDSEDRYTFKIDAPEPEYKVSYEIGYVPTFNLRGIDNSEVFDVLTISDAEDLAIKELEEMRVRAGKPNPVEDTPQAGDLLKIAVQELESAEGDLKAEGMTSTLSFAMDDVADEALKSALLTKRQGDTLRLNVFTIENRDEKFVRRYMLGLDTEDDREVGEWFEGQIEEVSRKGMAEVNEEFLTENFGETVTTEAEAIEALKISIAQFYAQRVDSLLMRDFQRRLLEVNDFELPDEFLKRYLVTQSDRKQNSDTSIKEMLEQYPAFATDLRWSVIQGAINQQYGLTVEEAEIRSYFRSQTARYLGAYANSLPPNFLDDMVARSMSNEKSVEQARETISIDKIFRLMRSRISVNEVPVTSTELQQRYDELSKPAKVLDTIAAGETAETETVEAEQAEVAA